MKGKAALVPGRLLGKKLWLFHHYPGCESQVLSITTTLNSLIEASTVSVVAIGCMQTDETIVSLPLILIFFGF
jgi:hypothetical protein